MDYFDRQIVNECNSIIDEYIETDKMNVERTLALVVHYIRGQFAGDMELHQSELPIKGLFK